MAEFIPVIAIAFIILIMALMLVAVSEQPIEYQHSYTAKTQKTSNYKSIVLDEDVKFKTQTEILAEISGNVSTSLLEKAVLEQEFTSSPYSRTLLEVDVKNTNSLGSLMFTLNNKEIYRSMEIYKEWEFDPSILEQDNILKAQAASPALVFWDTNYYEFTAKLKALTQWQGYYQFSAESSKKYRLFADIEDSTGGITIHLNNREIYSGTENETIDVVFNSLNSDNLLHFEPWDNSEYDFSLIYLQVS